MVIVNLEALLLNTFPKSMDGGVKVIELTVKTQSIENLTGRT